MRPATRWFMSLVLLCSGCQTVSPGDMLPDPTGEPVAIFVDDGDLFALLDGGQIQPLPATPQFEGQPDVSPQGDRIAVVADGVINVMNLDGSDRRMLPTPGQVTSVRWHPSQNQLVFAEDTGRVLMSPGFLVGILQIRIMDVATGAASTITEGPGYDGPAVAPNAEHIAFTEAVGSGNSRIHIISPAGSDQRQLTTEPFGLFGLAFDWLPDGRIIYTQVDTGAPAGENFRLETITPDNNDPQLVAARSTTFTRLRALPEGAAILCLASGDLGVFNLADLQFTTLIDNGGGLADPVARERAVSMPRWSSTCTATPASARGGSMRRCRG